MKTRTTIEIPSSDIKICHNDRIITIGSCFADRVGSKLESLKYPGIFNPLGILYNPISILKALQSIDLELSPNPKLFCLLDGVQMHFNYHSELSATTKEKYNDLIIQNNKKHKRYLKNAQSIIITLGSSYVYEHISSGQIIANCHKQDASVFSRRILSYDECKDSTVQLVKLVRSFNPTINIILTVSPIRHVRDTLVGNSKSKAILLNTVHHIVDHFDACDYFPAYEIMIDDLRDYRYYEDDMIHPTNKAFEYIWKLFSNSYITLSSQDLNKKIEKILRAVQHRPFRKDSSNHLAFVENTLRKIRVVEHEFPALDWSVAKEKLLNSKES